MRGKPRKKLEVVKRQPVHVASVPAVFAIQGRLEGSEAVGQAAQGFSVQGIRRRV
jgi:hypothetical protein